MAHFEKYHPLLSAHYQLDWLTLYRLKDIYRLRQDVDQAALSGRTVDHSIEATAHYVNEAMRFVMADNSLLYGIGDRQSKAFLGSICLWRFDSAMTEAQLRFEVLPETPAAVMAEILPRVAGFAFFELGLSTLYVLLPATATAEIAQLEATHFAQSPTDHTRALPDGSKVPLVRLTLTRTTVAEKPEFQF
ncbi:GNAT family N-acetyltransferase [Lacticaseibacillus daqingensis]|uniref:GNAT family N-acetyltransferase n=1 Tax=Lacticaseibacillus daqingensis TaxID=2486014 RepID=UPI000F7A9FB2|nr:N-acetyltransferase [Lacticaseibacillus daqingensis]